VGSFYDYNLRLAIQDAYNHGVLVVGAAGNLDAIIEEDQTEEDLPPRINLDLEKMYPVCFVGNDNKNIILGVGASNKEKELARFSNYGSDCVDLLAPGQDIYGALVFDSQETELDKLYDGQFSGTSLASPIISGIAGLIKASRPDLNNIQIQDIILQNTQNIDQQNPDFIGGLGQGLVDPVKIANSLATVSRKYTLIKSFEDTVYYYGLDGKRYVFPDRNVFLSWFDNFDQVQSLTIEELAQIPYGDSNITVKPGKYLLKSTTDPRVYAVSAGGVLRWVKTEDMAQQLYGEDWASKVIDIDDAFLGNYKKGEVIDQLSDYNANYQINQALSIDFDKGLII